MAVCPFCNSELDDDVKKCKNYGEWVNKSLPERTFGRTLAYAFFFGFLGVHRFHTGYKKIGIIQVVLSLTLLGLLISWPWSFIDTISIALKKYKDSQGRELNDYNRNWGIAVAIIATLCFICNLVNGIQGWNMVG